ncbi:helix-turn-helix domain-containing protein [Streptomyces sp. NPDC059818]|uniref:helix-turn-helix domain-containing protein n=1 Tax=Streptomyces TaxID=1883 RepID=UPI002E3394C0|nr:helix-turn-helix domain-containing protein [Streptomyces brevispora]
MRRDPGPTLDEVKAWPATVDVPAAAEALGVSRAHLYALVKRGDAPVRTLTFGKSHRVVTASLVRLLEAA